MVGSSSHLVVPFGRDIVKKIFQAPGNRVAILTGYENKSIRASDFFSQFRLQRIVLMESWGSLIIEQRQRQLRGVQDLKLHLGCDLLGHRQVPIGHFAPGPAGPDRLFL
jgi:hypothetical protein